ncbi:hypothetical protein [Trinickia dinghuensis]|uniref:Uncharacterized protein n=1 Tax=Trinickia dinghuensis TaxID=2291023 RepID=A0A3D8JR97_9BURK|nr:hypothetical protein [Trinickia dinghuensis]RDU95245.1 hypothetical protein DWV00_30130 [Trinickia dinghuensis]
MDAIQAVYTASHWLECLRIQQARADLSVAQKDTVIRIALDEIERVLAEAKAINPAPVRLGHVDKILLDKFGPDALKPPADADNEPNS